MQLFRVLSAVIMSSTFVACMSNPIDGTGDFVGSSGSSGSRPQDPPECSADADCAFRDTDQDACTTAICQSGKCVEKLVKNTAECQCHTVEDCTYYDKKACTELTCEAHKCVKNIVPAGPAPTQREGDCSKDVCDGTSELATKQYDEQDLGDTSNPCVVKSCDATNGLKQTTVANGTACGDGSVCFQGKCLACKPQNASSCGAEGPGEPTNDSSSTPAAFPQQSAFCAFTSGTDVDWYTFYAKDADLSYDVFDFTLWSTAPTLEVCIYVKCGSGSPGGGCATKLPGPNGSQGCCWTGAPATLDPSWDLDCSGTGEDSGTAYVSVRAPGADTCEPYAIVGGY
ncbi:MAG TPA: hypothetical protein VM925_07795 [Labilithrix sp.]|nr:hypothetical protein [Labilithrix sp.]